MPKIYTRFNVAESLNKNKIYDRHDNVDRLSYVDNTRLIQRFIYEGQNLANVRARALRSGMYSGEDALLDNGDPIIPLFEMDPAIAQPIIDNAKQSLKSRVASKNNDANNDELVSDSDSSKRSPDVTESKG